jgi:hypothetical protein
MLTQRRPWATKSCRRRPPWAVDVAESPRSRPLPTVWSREYRRSPWSCPAPRLGQRSPRTAARHRPCSEEGSYHRKPTRSCSPSRPTSGENPLRPLSTLGHSAMRSPPQSVVPTPLGQAPMEPPPCACARAATGRSQLPRRLILPVRPRLDGEIPFRYIKSRA